MTNVTELLEAIQQGQPQAAEDLLPLVYDELRKLASARLANEKPGQTLQATALVHEAYLRLVGNQGDRRQEAVHPPYLLSPVPCPLSPSLPAATSLPPPPRPCGGF